MAKKKRKSNLQHKKRAAYKRKHDLVQRSISMPGIVDGGREAYARVVNMVEAYRYIFRRLDAMLTMSQLITTDMMSPKELEAFKQRAAKASAKEVAKRKRAAKKGSKKQRAAPKPVDPGKFYIRTDNEAARRLSAELTDGRLNLPGYELRPYFFKLAQEARQKGIVDFASHMWDVLRAQLVARRSAAVSYKDHGGARSGARMYGVLSGALGLLDARNLEVPILRTADRKYAKLVEDERGVRLQLRWGNEETARTEIVLKGTTVGDDKQRERKAGKSIDYMLHKFVTEEYEWQTPTLQINAKGHVYVNFRYTKPRIRAATRKNSVMQVSFFAVRGSELPRTKVDQKTGKNDDKMYVIHMSSGKRVLRIAADATIAQLDRLTQEQLRAQREWNSRRRWKRKLQQPLKERLARLTHRRMLQCRDANHAWSHKIAEQAAKWGCGLIKLYGVPTGVANGLTGDSQYPWQWAQLAEYITYKADERGIKTQRIVQSGLVSRLVEQLKKGGVDGEDEDKVEDAAAD